MAISLNLPFSGDLYGNPEIALAALYDRDAGAPVEGVEVFNESWLTVLVRAENTEPEEASLDVAVSAFSESSPEGEVVATQELAVPPGGQSDFLIDVWLEEPGSYFLVVNDSPAGRVEATELEKRPFSLWVESRPPGDLAPADARGPSDRAPGSNLPNLVRFALGEAADSDPGIIEPEIEDRNGEDYMTFSLPTSDAALGVRLGVEFSDSLDDWAEAESSLESKNIEVTEEPDGTLVFRDSTPVGSAPARFARIVAQKETLSFQDSAFENKVRAALAGELNRPELTDPEEPIDYDDAAALTALTAIDQGISDLAGVGQLWNLRSFRLDENPVSDLQPLAELPLLESLQLSDTNATDLAPLSSADRLHTLVLRNTPVSDLSGLSGLGQLSELDLAGSAVTDLSPVSSLPGLRVLSLADTAVDDITPLDAHPSLREINLGATQVDDLDALRDIPNLDRIDLSNNTALQSKPGNVAPLQPLLSTSAQQILLEGTTGLDWNDYNETWLWVDRLEDEGRFVAPENAAGPLTEVTVSLQDEDGSHTAPPTEVSFTTLSGSEQRILVQPGTTESLEDVAYLTRVTPLPGGGWRITPTVPGYTPADAWRILSEYDRSIQLKTRPVGTLVFELRKSDYYVEGVLVDDNGDYLAGEDVRITDLETGDETLVQTDFDGHFHLDFDELKPGEVLVEPLVADLEFTPLQTLNVRDYGEISPTTFGPDEKIAFVDGGNLYVIDPDGTDQQQVNARTGAARLPNWSPDGDELLYNEGDSLRKVSASGVSDTEIVGAGDFGSSSDTFLFFMGSSWAPDDTVVFSADAEVGSSPQLVLQNVLWETGPNGQSSFDTSDIVQEQAWEPGEYEQTLLHPDFSPDGTQILYTAGKNTRPDFDDVDVTPGVWLLDYEGSDERQLLVEDASHPSWSPDGSEFAYQKNGELYIRQIDGSASATRLADTHTEVRRPSWSPDGEWIVYENDEALYRIHVDGGDPIYLTDGTDPAWSPDSGT